MGSTSGGDAQGRAAMTSGCTLAQSASPTHEGQSRAASVPPGLYHHSLRSYGIELSTSDEFPDRVDARVQRLKSDRNSVGLALAGRDRHLRVIRGMAKGSGEGEIASLFHEALLPGLLDANFGFQTGLKKVSSVPMREQPFALGARGDGSIGISKPDILYGCHDESDTPFSTNQLQTLRGAHPENRKWAFGTQESTAFPFLAIEFKSKASSGNGQGLLVATSQLLAASALPLAIVEQSNKLASQKVACSGIKWVDEVVYSIAIDNKMAEIFVTWRERDGIIYTQEADSFLLRKPLDYESFRKQMRNILQ